MANVSRFLASLAGDKSWEVKVSLRTKTRTPRQLRYLNGVVYKTIGDAIGYDRDDVSEFLCGSYFGWRTKVLLGGRKLEVPVRTTTTDENGERAVLNRREFGDFVDFCQRFAADHCIYVPDPEPEDLPED